MLRNTRVQMAGVLAVGVLLGYLTASGKFTSLMKGAAPPGGAAAGGSTEADEGCCADGLGKV